MERSSAAFSGPLKLGILPKTGLGERQATGHKEFIRMGESLALRGGVAHEVRSIFYKMDEGPRSF